MATPRLLGRKIIGHFKFPLSSPLLRKHKYFNYSYKRGLHAALFIHTNRKYKTSSLLKTVYNNIGNNIKNVYLYKNICIKNTYLYNYVKLTADAGSLFYNALYEFISPKSMYYVLSSGSPCKNQQVDDGNQEKTGLPGDDLGKTATSDSVKFLAVSIIVLLWLSDAKRNVLKTSWPMLSWLILQSGEVERLVLSSDEDRVYDRVYLPNGLIINSLERSGFVPHSLPIENLKALEEKIKRVRKELGIMPSGFIRIKNSPWNYSDIMSTLVTAAVIVGMIGFAVYSALKGKGGAAQAIFRAAGNLFASHTRVKATNVLHTSRKGIGLKDVARIQEVKQAY